MHILILGDIEITKTEAIIYNMQNAIPFDNAEKATKDGVLLVSAGMYKNYIVSTLISKFVRLASPAEIEIKKGKENGLFYPTFQIKTDVGDWVDTNSKTFFIKDLELGKVRIKPQNK